MKRRARGTWVAEAMAAALLASTGCASAPAPAPGGPAPASATKPAAPAPAAASSVAGPFEKLVGREVSGLTARPLQFAGGALDGQVESATNPTVARDGEAWNVTVPIGTQSPITCFVYEKAIDAAGSLMRFIGLVTKKATDITIIE